MKNKVQNLKTKMIRILIIAQAIMLWQIPVYAKGGLQKSKIYTGDRKSVV